MASVRPVVLTVRKLDIFRGSGPFGGFINSVPSSLRLLSVRTIYKLQVPVQTGSFA